MAQERPNAQNPPIFRERCEKRLSKAGQMRYNKKEFVIREEFIFL